MAEKDEMMAEGIQKHVVSRGRIYVAKYRQINVAPTFAKQK